MTHNEAIAKERQTNLSSANNTPAAFEAAHRCGEAAPEDEFVAAAAPPDRGGRQQRISRGGQGRPPLAAMRRCRGGGRRAFFTLSCRFEAGQEQQAGEHSSREVRLAARAAAEVAPIGQHRDLQAARIQRRVHHLR